VSERFLISSLTLREAGEMANFLGLKNDRWEHIYNKNYSSFRNELHGITGINPKNLIGYFSTSEARELTRDYKEVKA